jgi:hypothetical protein
MKMINRRARLILRVKERSSLTKKRRRPKTIPLV